MKMQQEKTFASSLSFLQLLGWNSWDCPQGTL